MIVCVCVSVQGIPLPDSGLSYNPSAAAHQKAVEAAAAVAVEERYRDPFVECIYR